MLFHATPERRKRFRTPGFRVVLLRRPHRASPYSLEKPGQDHRRPALPPSICSGSYRQLLAVPIDPADQANCDSKSSLIFSAIMIVGMLYNR
jgi:hypothetical protein